MKKASKAKSKALYNPVDEQPAPSASIARVPWSPLFGAVFVVGVFYISQIVAGLLITIYPEAKMWSAARTNDWLTNSVVAQFLYILMAEAFTIEAVYYYVVKRCHAKLSIIGLRKPRWGDIIYALAAVIPYYALYLLMVGVVSHFVPGFDVNEKQQIGFDNVYGGAQLTMTFISLVVLPPIAEEIMVRGFLYSSLRKGMSLVPAALLTSLIFAAAHLAEGGAAGPLYIAALDTFVLSLVLIYLREKTGGLWASIYLHAIKNGVAFIALFILSTR
ncbi:MAG TPA: type II CAAX endopeptidase family protein [Candidatus Saccharimonadales bacterium]|nr:type II CAAX endopeptidase family protein [Candidatus Saccharimonadales bacterium]